MLRRLGFGRDAITLEVLLTGVWNAAVKVGLPLVALVSLVLAGDQAGWLMTAAVTAMVAIVAGIGLVWAGVGFFPRRAGRRRGGARRAAAGRSGGTAAAPATGRECREGARALPS